MKLQTGGTFVAFGIAAFLWAGVARGADAPPATAEVLGKLHHSNQMEISAGKLAQERGQSKDVKSFGKTLVTDHSAADRKVMALAKEQKIDLAPGGAPMPGMDKLKTLSGAEFDRMFASEMLKDHEKDVAEAKSARDSTNDAKLKALLAGVVPVLEKHRDTAQKLVDKLGPSASAAGTNITTVPTPTQK
jgi:putative membrane protein